jgi:hypothetical protein
MLKNLLRGVFARTERAAPGSANPLLDYALRNAGGRVMNKWDHYFEIYHRHFARFRGQRITMLEIGVFNGGSLAMWRDYFGPQARIVGVDVNPDCAAYAAPGIEIVIGDQGDRGFLRSLVERFPAPEIVLDDGGHHMQQQVATFEEVYPRMHPGGVYVCEDTHTSYLAHFGGGKGRAGTFIETAKALVDRLHTVEGAAGAMPSDPFTLATDSVHFYDRAVVIERRSRKPPVDAFYGSEAQLKYVAPSVSGRLDPGRGD